MDASLVSRLPYYSQWVTLEQILYRGELLTAEFFDKWKHPILSEWKGVTELLTMI